MHLIYLDESGNTGQNLKDPDQPVFVLGALVVPEEQWQPLESRFHGLIHQFFPTKSSEIEIHAAEIRNGKGYFREVPLIKRLEFLAGSLSMVRDHELRIICRKIEKARFARWVESAFPRGVSINPHVVAYPLVARVLDDYLQSQGADARGILISDENREIVGDVKKTTDLLRLTDSSLRLHRIIEQCFFVDSRTSVILQLCDICTFYSRKMAEFDMGRPVAHYDRPLIDAVRALQHRGAEAFDDTIRWIIAEQKKERPEEESPGR